MSGEPIKISIYAASVGTLIVLLFIIYRVKHKNQLHWICSANVLLSLAWTILQMTRDVFCYTFFGIFTTAESILTFFMPCTLLLLSITLMKDRIKHTAVYILIFTPPVISSFLYLTSSIHKLFIISRSSDAIVAGPYYYIHYTWQIVYLTVSIFYVVYFSLKYTGHLSKQNLLFIIGILVPILFEYVSYFTYTKDSRISYLPGCLYALTYSFAAVCLTISIYKYNFMVSIPISTKSIVDHFSDSFLVVDYRNNVLEMNRNFKENFGNYIYRDKINVFEVLDNNLFEDFNKRLEESIKLSKSSKQTIKFEYQFKIRVRKYFNIEIIPIFKNKRFMATLVFLKDISIHKQLLELKEENTLRLIEKERLISLNQLIGGLAHNIKSPLMASSGGISVLEKNTHKIDALLSELNIYSKSPEFITTINDMKKWENQIKQYLIYISDIVSAVKDQTTSMNSPENAGFTVEKLLNQVTVLMEFELKKAKCVLNKNLKVSPDTLINGNITALTQILDNIVINSIQSYGNNGGFINLTVEKDPKGIVIIVQDNGSGIAPEILQKLFVEMVTTKGSDGSGLGLYLAGIAVKGQFNGSIYIDSELNKGTEVHIFLPLA
ncbi:histidine kinase-like protein [Ruminiclostridium sufflavum DSM 19573]|uniref:histidine kinase n=1 Tax=Ruminiclostridium sufflavum DSM 19573 TaxID=1121337 RepID=A0A318XRZ6_9FIRM|nr:ATP-binding protein [Ruminiclostridium sufflavum]PYG90377.1 histidine kinase-like protein [Ruminiclostridium sufflavum DSM 19573]